MSTTELTTDDEVKARAGGGGSVHQWGQGEMGDIEVLVNKS